VDGRNSGSFRGTQTPSRTPPKERLQLRDFTRVMGNDRRDDMAPTDEHRQPPTVSRTPSAQINVLDAHQSPLGSIRRQKQIDRELKFEADPSRGGPCGFTIQERLNINFLREIDLSGRQMIFSWA
jgi:hypothetical protein